MIHIKKKNFNSLFENLILKMLFNYLYFVLKLIFNKIINFFK